MVDFPLVHYVLRRNGCDLHYWMTGSHHHPLVVLTHGAWIDHTEFESLVPALKDKYRLLLWDVRGHGLSKPADPRFSIHEAMLDMLALIDTQQTGQVILIGHSMGGNLSQEIVFYHPERVQALVCVDCTCNTLKLTSIEKIIMKLAFPLLHLYPYEVFRKQAANISALSPKATRRFMKC
jgi:pimeloyl-ACP methyl ester carboxylesterase